MSWYPPPSNATTGFTGIIDAVNAGLSQPAIAGTAGANMVSLLLLVPAWAIIFLPMARFNPEAAWVVASFICTIIATYLLAIGYLNPLILFIFLSMTILGVISFYLHTRS